MTPSAKRQLNIRVSDETHEQIAAISEVMANISQADVVQLAVRRLAVSEGIVPPREHYEYGDPNERDGKEAAMFLKSAESSLNSASVDLGRALNRMEKKKD